MVGPRRLVDHQRGERAVAEGLLVLGRHAPDAAADEHDVAVGGHRPRRAVRARRVEGVVQREHPGPPPAGALVVDPPRERPRPRQVLGGAVGGVADDDQRQVGPALPDGRGRGGQGAELRVEVLGTLDGQRRPLVQREGRRRRAHRRLGVAVAGHEAHGVEQVRERGVAVAPDADQPVGVDEQQRPGELRVVGVRLVEHGAGGLERGRRGTAVADEGRPEALGVDGVGPRALPGGQHHRAHRAVADRGRAAAQEPPARRLHLARPGHELLLCQAAVGCEAATVVVGGWRRLNTTRARRRFRARRASIVVSPPARRRW